MQNDVLNDLRKEENVFFSMKTKDNLIICHNFATIVDSNENILFAAIGGNDSNLKGVRALLSMKKIFKVCCGHYSEYTLKWNLNEYRGIKSKANGGLLFGYGDSNFNKKFLYVLERDVSEKGYLSTNNDGHQQIAELLRAAPYGLPILDEWENPFFNELCANGHVQECFGYYDSQHFPNGVSVGKIISEPEDIVEFMDSLIKAGKLPFPIHNGTGEEIWKIETLDDYLLRFSPSLLDQVKSEYQPLHDPVKDKVYKETEDYKTPLFPMQKHVVTSLIKGFSISNGMILQGEMATGKSFMMTATVDGYMRKKNKKGYHALIVCPVNLPIKWKEEILKLIPTAEIYVINETAKIPLLYKYHSKWVREGKMKPIRPVFFIATYSTMKFQYEETYGGQLKHVLNKKGIEQTRFACPKCGAFCGKKIKDGKQYFDEHGKIRQDYKVELFEIGEEVMKKNSSNVFCSNCGEYMFGPAVKTRRKSFSDWNKNVAEPLVKALNNKDFYSSKRIIEAERIRERQNYYKTGDKTSFGKIGNATYRESLANYVRHRMNKFFDMTIFDEVHNLKSLTTGQGVASGKIIARSKKVLGGTGTLLGGLATDVFSILFRFFPKLLLSDGFSHNSVNKWGNAYGNTERIIIHAGGYEGYQKLAGGREVIEHSPKSVPGISPLVFAKFLLQNTVNLRLLDVWETPTDLVEIPTILCPMNSEQKEMYQLFEQAYDRAANQYRFGGIRGMIELAYVKAGVTLPDLMTKHPDVSITLKGTEKASTVIKMFETKGKHISEEIITPKEKKMVDIIGTESSLRRPVILFVTSTGSEKNPTMDLRSRLCDVLKRHGIKTIVMRRDSCKINERTQWMTERIIDDGYEVIICNMSLVKEGVDLIFAPTILFYQFHWSMFVIAQSARRAWRINQTRECRIFYLATEDTMQEKMALLVAKKARASDVINGEASSGGLSAMLGDDGDLMSQLLKEIRTGENSIDSNKLFFEERDEAAERVFQQIGCKLTPIDEILDPRAMKPLTRDSVNKVDHRTDENVDDDEWNIFTIFGLGSDTEVTVVPVNDIVLIENEVINIKRKTIGQLSLDLFGEMEEI